jgi:protein-L-isoaspartate(D-aspartate) O-methyltransferase
MGIDLFSIERHTILYKHASQKLLGMGYNPNLILGDGFGGYENAAPYDSIIVTAAAEELPSNLLKQLKIGGIMVIPYGGRDGQKMLTIKRMTEKDFQKAEHGSFQFVPMIKGIVK